MQNAHGSAAPTDNRGIPVRRNLVLAAAALALNGWLWLGLPLLLSGRLELAWSLIGVVLLTTTIWSLMHEGIHAVLHPDRAVNDALARALAIGFPAPFAVLRFGHLKHHQFNRTAVDRSEVYDPDCASRASAAAGYYARLLGGLYAGEVAALLLAWLPRPVQWRLLARLPSEPDGPSLADSARRQLLRSDVLWSMRLDSALSLILVAASLWLYGPAFWLLGLALIGRGLLISLADNAYHYATALHAPGADVRPARNLALPGWAERAILNFNHHATHHRHPGLPWTALPEASAALKSARGPGYLCGLLAQLRGPIALSSLPMTPAPRNPAANRGAEPGAG